MAYGPQALAFRHPVEKVDIEAISSPSGWLTSACITHIVLARGDNYSSAYNFVDPTWLREWELTNMARPPHTPSFLLRKAHTWEDVKGLVFPYNENNNHWSAVYLDLRTREAIFYNSMKSRMTARKVRRLMERFLYVYEDFFEGWGELTWVEDRECAQQRDGSSCGIYTCLNIIAILNGEDVSEESLSRSELAKFREEGAAILRGVFYGGYSD